MPAESLVGIEELLTVPAFWVMLYGFINRGVFGGAQESFQAVVLLTLSTTLDRLPIRFGVAVFRSIRTFGCGITNPVVGKQLRGHALEFPEEPFRLWHRQEQIKG